MKKIFFTLAVLVMAICASAQTNQYFWYQGNLMMGNPIAQIDSVTFGEGEPVDTLHIMLPRTIIKTVHDTLYITVHDTIYIHDCDTVQWINPFIGMVNDSVFHFILPPDDEIWYTSLTNDTLPFPRHGGTMISNTYVDGKGIYKFDAPITNGVFNRGGFRADDSGQTFSYITSMVLPNSVTELNVYQVLSDLAYCKYLILPNSLSSIGTDFMGGYGKFRDDGPVHVFFTSQVAPSHNSRTFWNIRESPDGTIYHYPIDGDYNSFIQSIDQEMAAEPKWKYKWQPTTYTFQ